MSNRLAKHFLLFNFIKNKYDIRPSTKDIYFRKLRNLFRRSVPLFVRETKWQPLLTMSISQFLSQHAILLFMSLYLYFYSPKQLF